MFTRTSVSSTQAQVMFAAEVERARERINTPHARSESEERREKIGTRRMGVQVQETQVEVCSPIDSRRHLVSVVDRPKTWGRLRHQ